jgi:hypothetical protein
MNPLGSNMISSCQKLRQLVRMKWKPRVDPLSYEHLNLELEWGDNGYLMGNYNGIVCGTAAAKKQT